jgi:hypothetical protein
MMAGDTEPVNRRNNVQPVACFTKKKAGLERARLKVLAT